ncbi:MAG: MoxR family ATPase [bacterium]
MNIGEKKFNALGHNKTNPEMTPIVNPESLSADQAIVETPTAMSYLGVELEKAPTGSDQFVPNREQYADFINDKEIALPLQRDIAVAFLSGEPMLIEGGTSLGKTTTVRKMAAELGWEVHYANLNGATDVEDLMGRYIPNTKKQKPEDPEYVFADGKVTSGLRQETDKTKVIILDEFNASAPNVLIRLHEVLDALERGGEVVLSEDASEVVPVSKCKTKVIALMNPPGKGYFGREPLDPAQLRRWVYKKMPSELPTETFSFATDALFGGEADLAQASPDLFLTPREQKLMPEQLPEIPGITEILQKYKEFHTAAKELLKSRKIAEDQPQQFTYDDRMEPRRVRDFVLRFYSGDINATFQQALKYYYANKLESQADKDKLNELIRLVECQPRVADPKRKGTEREKTKKEGGKIGKESSGEVIGAGETSLEQAEKIMGDNFYGREEIKNTFGIELARYEVPAIPYTPEQLEQAKELGESLILRINQDAEGNAMTMKRINQIMAPKMAKYSDSGKLLCNPDDWYKNEAFYKKQSLKTEWKLVGGSFVPDLASKKDKEGKYAENSRGKNYIHQTRLLRDYLHSIGSLTEIVGWHARDEILHGLSEQMGLDWKTQEITNQSKYDANWQLVVKRLAELEVNKNHRRTPAEIIYDQSLQFTETGDRGLLKGSYDWSNAVSSDGFLVRVGDFDAVGALVLGCNPDGRRDDIGAVSLR